MSSDDHVTRQATGNGQALSLTAAAQRLGVSAHTARWLRLRGELPGVHVEPEHSLQEVGPAERSDKAEQLRNGTGPATILRPTAPTWGEIGALLREKDELIAGLARERDQRVDEKEQQVLQLSGQVGFLQAKLQDAEEQLKLLQAPPSSLDEGSAGGPDSSTEHPPAPDTSRRRWWLRWLQ